MEEDYRLFQLIKRNPINSCADLSKNMRGRKNGMLYFTENFRIDFENKMTELGKYQAKSKEDEAVIEEQNRMIDLIIDKFKEGTEYYYSEFDYMSKEDIKEYFRNKAKEKNNNENRNESKWHE